MCGLCKVITWHNPDRVELLKTPRITVHSCEQLSCTVGRQDAIIQYKLFPVALRVQKSSSTKLKYICDLQYTEIVGPNASQYVHAVRTDIYRAQRVHSLPNGCR